MRKTIGISLLCTGMLASFSACSGDSVMGFKKAVPGIESSKSIPVEFKANGYQVGLVVPGGGSLVSDVTKSRVQAERTSDAFAEPTVVYERKYEQEGRGHTTGAFRVWIDIVAIPNSAEEAPTDLTAFAKFIGSITASKMVGSLVTVGDHDWVKREVVAPSGETSWLYSHPLDHKAYLTVGFRFSADRARFGEAWLSEREVDITSTLKSVRISTASVE